MRTITDHTGEVIGVVVWNGGELLPDRDERPSAIYTKYGHAEAKDRENVRERLRGPQRTRVGAISDRMRLAARENGKRSRGRVRTKPHYDLTVCACGCGTTLTPPAPATLKKNPHRPRFVDLDHRRAFQRALNQEPKAA